MTDNIKAKGETPEESIVSMIEPFIEDCFNERTPSKKAIIEGVRYILAGRSRSVESEKAKDERIKELEDGLRKIAPMVYRKFAEIVGEYESTPYLIIQQLLNK